MWSRSGTKAVTAAIVLGAALAGCSDIYYDRRDTISIVSGEAMAANRVTHMIDPWPPASRNRTIAFSGERMQAAHERYRTGCVYRADNPTTSSAAYAQAQQAQQLAQCNKAQAAAAQSGVPIK